jgi:thiamine biosynthesis lipoprotein ApbE
MSEGFDGVKQSVDAANASLNAMTELLAKIERGVNPLPPTFDKAAKAAADLQKEIERNEQASKKAFSDAVGISSFVDSLNRVGDAFGKATEKNNTFTGRMAAGAAGAVQFARVVAGLASSLMDAAAKADQHADAVNKLGGAYDAVRRATNDVVSAEQALSAQQRIVQSGLRVSNAELAAITRAAREYADATGGDVNSALDGLTSALQSGSAPALRRYGITVAEGTTRIRAFHSATQQLANAQRGAAPAARNLSEENDLYKRSLDESLGSMALAIAKAIHLQTVFRNITESIEMARNAFARFDTWVRGYQHTSVRGVPGWTPPAPNTSGGQGPAAPDVTGGAGAGVDDASLDRRMGGGGGGGGGGGRGGISVRDALEYTEAIRAAQNRLRMTGIEQMPVVEREIGQDLKSHLKAQLDAINSAVRDQERAHQSATERMAQRDREFQERREAEVRAWNEKIAQRYAEFDKVIDGAADADRLARLQTTLREQLSANDNAVDGMLDRMRELRDTVAEQSDVDVERAMAEVNAIRQVIDAHNELLRTRERAADYNVQFTEATKQAFHLQETTAQGAAGVFNSTIGTMTSAFKTHLAAVIQGRESIGEALRAIAQETLTALAVESAVQALFETAKGIAKLASSYGTDVSATGHFAAAGIYAAVATAAGGTAYALSASASKPAAASGMSANGSQGPARAGPSSTAGGQGGVTNVFNVNGTLTREDAQDAIVRALNEAGERGNHVRNAA